MTKELVAGFSTLLGVVLTLVVQRRKDRRIERDRLAVLYGNPLLFAAEDLQSRVYNVLCRNGLRPLREHHQDGSYAEETLYYVARYFAFEQALLRFTPFGADPEVVARCQAVRRAFATDAGGLDPWCLFRSTQLSLGQSVLTWHPGEVGAADVKSFVEFQDLIRDERLLERLHIGPALGALRDAAAAADLPDRTAARLAAVQMSLVDLLEKLEATIDKGHPWRRLVNRLRRRAPFSVSAARPRARASCRPDTARSAAPAD